MRVWCIVKCIVTDSSLILHYTALLLLLTTGWISYRGFLDVNQLVLHNVMWRNPPAFADTPFLLRIRQLQVSFHPLHLISFRRNGALKGTLLSYWVLT